MARRSAKTETPETPATVEAPTSAVTAPEEAPTAPVEQTRAPATERFGKLTRINH